MKISNKNAFILQLGEEFRIYDDRSEAISKLKESIPGDYKPEEAVVWNLDMNEEEWKIESIPWSEIAFELAGD